jgi:glycosyltransferase involved in cell wall biosynthesis
MRNVLILQRRLPEYRVPFFSQLRERLASRGVQLTVVHGAPAADEEARKDGGVVPWALRTNCHYFDIRGHRLTWQHFPWTLVGDQSLIVLGHENGQLVNYPLLFGRGVLGQYRCAWWGHGPRFPQSGAASRREQLKAYTARRSDWCFAYTEVSVNRFVAAGVPRNRITCVNNAIDLTALRSAAESISEDERNALRHRLGIAGGHTAVTLCSLTPEKRIDFLIEAADMLRSHLPQFHLIVIGDGPLRRYLESAAESRPWLHPVGAQHGREKALYCSPGRIMLNPGMVGLGIVDSFALGLPIVTTSVKTHSPEIAYLESDVNGVMTRDDVAAFANSARELLTDERRLERLVQGCRGSSATYTVEAMAERFTNGIIAALDG